MRRTTIPFNEIVRTPPAGERTLLLERILDDGTLLSVTEGRGVRMLHLGASTQSEVGVDKFGHLRFELVEEWTQAMVACTYSWSALQTQTHVEDRLLPNVLMVGGGGGIIARALLSKLHVHIVELEPVVLEVAQTHFGLHLGTQCSATFGDGATFLAQRADAVRAGTASRFGIVLIDCFTPDGVAPCVADGSICAPLADCVAPDGLAIVNLHRTAGTSSEDPSDEAWAAPHTVMSRLRERFDTVMSLSARTSRNVLALCHQGEPRSIDAWCAAVDAGLGLGAAAACPDVTGESLRERLRLFGEDQVARGGGAHSCCCAD